MNIEKEFQKNLAAIDCNKCRKEWADGCDGFTCAWEDYEIAIYEKAVNKEIDRKLGK